ncbi:hypothetical protein L208DRAFT_1524352 [Tricholoma matsutake]|nr:hypothetical protein L208DRAFT_1524352 [Tricholoma matsutake 945]
MALAGSKTSNPPHANNGLQPEQIEALVCIFCGLARHFISDCLVCQSYINKGKCKKNTEGKVVLPNGQFTPRNIPGRYIKERVDEWLRRNPQVTITPSLMYNIASSISLTTLPRGMYQVSEVSNTADDRIAELEEELFTLRSGRPYAQTDRNMSTAQPRPSNPVPPTPVQPTTAPRAPVPSTLSMATNPPTSTSASATESSPTLPPIIHPYTTAKENSYLPPHKRNFTSTGKGKGKEGPSHHIQAPIHKDKIAEDIFTRSMKTPIITLTSKELLSVAPEVRTKWKEQVTTRCVQQTDNAMNILDDDVYVLDNPYKTYINSLRPSDIPEPFIITKESHAIRSVIINVNGRNPVESVIDPGSSIIAMLEEVCHEVSLTYNPSIRIPLQLANGGIDESLSLACNVPCEVGTITLYMQIHIICDPAYDILFGRPFEVLTESTVKNYRNELQTITILNPNLTQSCTIPMIPRSNQCRKVVRKDFRS